MKSREYAICGLVFLGGLALTVISLLTPGEQTLTSDIGMAAILVGVGWAILVRLTPSC